MASDCFRLTSRRSRKPARPWRPTPKAQWHLRTSQWGAHGENDRPRRSGPKRRALRRGGPPSPRLRGPARTIHPMAAQTVGVRWLAVFRLLRVTGRLRCVDRPPPPRGAATRPQPRPAAPGRRRQQRVTARGAVLLPVVPLLAVLRPRQTAEPLRPRVRAGGRRAGNPRTQLRRWRLSPSGRGRSHQKLRCQQRSQKLARKRARQRHRPRPPCS
mmetsp:Transcript_34672/g.95547  ORF Transcript_34672/g.95547 Transcript_34672/m.95547 type:complete len:214 (+) Transcript_34672:1203-1844(+)